MSLLNLGGLLTIGNGQQPSNNGAINLALPGVVDLSLLPGNGNNGGLLGGVLGGNNGGLLGGLLGGNNGGLLGGVLGGNNGGVVGGLLGNDGLLDDVLGGSNGGLLGGLLGGNGGGLLGGVLGGNNGGLLGGLLGGSSGGVLGSLLSGNGGLLGGVLGDGKGGLLGGLLTDGKGGLLGGTVGGLLGPVNGVLTGLLGGNSVLSTLLGNVGGGVQDLLSGLGAATGSIGKGVGDLLGDLLGGGANGGPDIIIINIPGGVEIIGTPSNDFLQGTAGNDRLYGGGGDDILDGLGGFDIGVYQGNHTDYVLTSNAGVLTVKDNIVNRDGTDTLRNMEFLQFKDGGVDIATGTFVAQAILNQTTTGYRAIVREDAPGGLTETVGVGIAQNKFSFDQYVDALIQDVKTSTIPALLMPSLVQGTIPTSERLDSLTAFAKEQFNYYKNVLGSAFSELGPYEALGRGLSTTTEFQNKYAGGTDAAFVNKAYQDVFGSGPGAAQQTALLQQVSYFENLYKGAGLSVEQADIQSRGAVYGQIVGHAAYATSEPYFGKADVLLTGFANGETAQYGAVFA